MENAIRSAQSFEGLGPQLSVRVGDHPNAYSFIRHRIHSNIHDSSCRLSLRADRRFVTNLMFEQSQTWPSSLTLYCPKDVATKNARPSLPIRSRSGRSPSPLLGIPRVSPQAGERHPQPAGGARYLR